MKEKTKKKQDAILQENREKELEEKIRELALTVDEVEDEIEVENQLKKARRLS